MRYRNLLILLFIATCGTVIGTGRGLLAQPADWSHFVDSAQRAWGAPDSKMLLKPERAKFEGVKYYPYDSAYVVAADYRALQDVDTIYVLNNGIVEEQGTHEELVANE